MKVFEAGRGAFMRTMDVNVCRKCVDKHRGQPPCVPVHQKATQRPCIRVMAVGDVGRSCLFHADWQELAPMLMSGRYEPFDSFSGSMLNVMAGILRRYMGNDAPRYALEPAAAAKVGYVKQGDGPPQWGQYVVVRAFPRDGTYQKFLAACNLHITTGGLNPQFVVSRWEFVTSSGGGGGYGLIAASGGKIVLQNPGGAQFSYLFGGAGPSIGWKKLPNWGVTGSRQSFYSIGAVLKNPAVYGFGEIEDPSDFNGAVLWGDISGSAGIGRSISAMVVGGPVFRAVIPIYGKIAGLTGSGSVYAGYLRR